MSTDKMTRCLICLAMGLAAGCSGSGTKANPDSRVDLPTTADSKQPGGADASLADRAGKELGSHDQSKVDRPGADLTPLSFDPVTAPNIGQAFAAAKTAAAAVYPNYQLSFVELQGYATTVGATYATTAFSWLYVFGVCDASGPICNNYKTIAVSYPGWTSKVQDSAPIGAFLDEKDFFSKVKLSFAEIIASAASNGVTMGSCPMQTSSGFIVLRGNVVPGDGKWFWEFGCAGSSSPIHDFDAASGLPL